MAFDYSTIFAAAEAGGVWLADSTHYTDDGRTTVAVNGNTVASFSDDSGNAKHFAQTTAGARAQLVQDAGGKWYLLFDGTDDRYSAGVAADWTWLHDATSAYVCVALRPDAAHTGNLAFLATFDGTTTVSGFFVTTDNRTSLGFNDGINVQVGKSVSGNYAGLITPQDILPLGEDSVIEIIKSVLSGVVLLKLFVNSLPIGAVQLLSPSSSNPSAALSLGNNSVAGNYYKGRIFSVLATDTIPSASDRIAIRQDMAERCVVNPLKINGGNTASVTIPLNDPASGGSAWASKTGLAVDVSVDRDSAPFYSATGQSTNGSGELAIAATGCPLAAGTQTVWIRITDSDGLAGGVGNDSLAFYSPVSVTVA